MTAATGFQCCSISKHVAAVGALRLVDAGRLGVLEGRPPANTPLDATLVRGSHGRLSTTAAESPVCVTQRPDLLPATAATGKLPAAEVHALILRHLGVGAPAAAGATLSAAPGAS